MDINAFREWLSEPAAFVTTEVTRKLTARHVDPRNRGDLHEHTWVFCAIWPAGKDARDHASSLEEALAPRQGAILPDTFTWAEQMAAAVLREIGAIAVRVSREPEGFASTAMISQKEYERLRKERSAAFSHWGSR